MTTLAPRPAYMLRALDAADAPAAAAIHAEGQPGTFLTRLGDAFLRALYTQMATSAHCFGYVAVEGAEIIGVVTGTLDSGQVFKELILRRGLRLAFPVLGALLRRPALVGKVIETLFYPAQMQPEPGEGELFFIGTRASRRGEGIGQALFQALAAEMRRRRMSTMGLIVDDSNATARRFYERQGMRPTRSFLLYGRPMQWYALSLQAGSADYQT